jgi:hypothetical protein
MTCPSSFAQGSGTSLTTPTADRRASAWRTSVDPHTFCSMRGPRPSLAITAGRTGSSLEGSVGAAMEVFQTRTHSSRTSSSRNIPIQKREGGPRHRTKSSQQGASKRFYLLLSTGSLKWRDVCCVMSMRCNNIFP